MNNSNPDLDEIDRTILEERISARMYHKGPRIGDYCNMLDGRRLRFSHDWGDDIQVSEGGSFYLSAGGYTSFSGGLEPAIPKSTISKGHEMSPLGSFWFFHHDHRGAHRGVQVKALCRVFEQHKDITNL